MENRKIFGNIHVMDEEDYILLMGVGMEKATIAIYF